MNDKEFKNFIWIGLVTLLGVIFLVMIANSSTNNDSTNSYTPPSQYSAQTPTPSTPPISSVSSITPIEPEEPNPAVPSVAAKSVLSPQRSQPQCIHTPQFDTNEESRMKEIMLTVMQSDVTTTLYTNFWSTMDKYGKICDEDIQLTKEILMAAQGCNKYFYEDALSSVRSGQIYKSQGRATCENKTYFEIFSSANSTTAREKTIARINMNNTMLRQIALGQPIATPSGGVVFTEELILTTLDNINAVFKRVDTLFTRTK